MTLESEIHRSSLMQGVLGCKASNQSNLTLSQVLNDLSFSSFKLYTTNTGNKSNYNEIVVFWCQHDYICVTKLHSL